MRKTFLPLLLVFVLSLTACSNASVMAQPPASSSEPVPSVSEPRVTEPSVTSSTGDSNLRTGSKTEEAIETTSVPSPETSAAEIVFETPTEQPTTPAVEPSTAELSIEQPETESPKADAPQTTPAPPVFPMPSTQPPATSSPEPSPVSAQPSRKYDMSDPNVKAYPIYATAKTATEFKAGMAEIGMGTWNSSTEIIAIQKNDDPDYMVDGMTFYDWRMKPIQEWVDNYLAINGFSYKGKTDYEKTSIIRKMIEDGLLEEFIGLWRPSFKFTEGDCVPRAEAMDFLMIAMDFSLLNSNGVGCNAHGVAHATNAYWDSEVDAIRFIDADFGFDVWNLFIDELDEKGFTLRVY